MASERTECMWCGERLRFVPGTGWVHAATGQLIVTRNGRDDHVATPNRSAS